MYLLGYDIGSSSVKAALVHPEKGVIAVVKSPATEMEILTSKIGWAEQNPETWWQNLIAATKKLLAVTKVNPLDIGSIGISYQMHGLVLLGSDDRPVRDAIIWCDSRASDIGARAFSELGSEFCLSNYLNSPGNFTAAKMKWVKDNEPAIYAKAKKFLLPGDFINLKLTGEIQTTRTGLSECILWNFKDDKPAYELLEHFNLDLDLLPELVDNFKAQSALSKSAAQSLNLKAGIPICYRAGDQPNNAMSLGVNKPNEVAATGGTSGVVYGIFDKLSYDPLSRVNGFAHVNHAKDNTSIGQLLCINGAGIQYAWLRKLLGHVDLDYKELEQRANTAPIGSRGIRILPFGNGAERMLENKILGAQILGLNFNLQGQSELYRAALEGVAFAFYYGIKIMNTLGLDPSHLKVGNDNLFRSKIFSQTLSNLANSEITVLETTGAIGAAKGAGIGVQVYSDLQEAFEKQVEVMKFEPNKDYENILAIYQDWELKLSTLLKN